MKAKALILLLCLLALLCAGCDQKAESVVPAEIAGDIPEEEIFDPEEMEVKTSQWPSDLLPASVPAYTDGELTGYDGVQSCMALSVTHTSEEEVEAYLQKLRDGGFRVNKKRVGFLDDLQISLEYLEASESVIISINYAGSELWPADSLGDMPELRCGIITSLSFDEENVVEMRFKNLSKEHAQAWFDALLESGFTQSGTTFTGPGTTIKTTDYGDGKWRIRIESDPS